MHKKYIIYRDIVSVSFCCFGDTSNLIAIYPRSFTDFAPWEYNLPDYRADTPVTILTDIIESYLRSTYFDI